MGISTIVRVEDGLFRGPWHLTHHRQADADGGVPGETSETNNLKYRSIKIGPDLIVSTLSAPSSARRGSTTSVTDTTKNQGGGAAGASTTKVYLSSNRTIGAGDQLLCTRDIPVLAFEGKSSGSPLSCTIAADTIPGDYYIIAKADANDEVPEFSEINNVKTKAIEIVP
jgi:subtilase family serine protease